MPSFQGSSNAVSRSSSNCELSTFNEVFHKSAPCTIAMHSPNPRGIAQSLNGKRKNKQHHHHHSQHKGSVQLLELVLLLVTHGRPESYSHSHSHSHFEDSPPSNPIHMIHSLMSPSPSIMIRIISGVSRPSYYAKPETLINKRPIYQLYLREVGGD